MKRIGLSLSIILSFSLMLFNAPFSGFAQPIECDQSQLFLIIGTDERNPYQNQSHTVFLASANPKTESVMLTHIPPDLSSSQTGQQQNDSRESHKIITKKEIENLLGLPIAGYVTIKMETIRMIVDRIDGIEVNVAEDFCVPEYSFSKGKRVMTGDQALVYSRIVLKDKQGNYKRHQRQEEVFKGVIKKSISPFTMLRILPIAHEIRKRVKTDIPPLTSFRLAYTYRNMDVDHIVIHSLKGKRIGKKGVYRTEVEKKEIDRIRAVIMKHLNK